MDLRSKLVSAAKRVGSLPEVMAKKATKGREASPEEVAAFEEKLQNMRNKSANATTGSYIQMTAPNPVVDTLYPPAAPIKSAIRNRVYMAPAGKWEAENPVPEETIELDEQPKSAMGRVVDVTKKDVMRAIDFLRGRRKISLDGQIL